MSCSLTVLLVFLFQVVTLQENVEQLESALQQQQAEGELLTVQLEANQANVLAKVSPTTQISEHCIILHHIVCHLNSETSCRNDQGFSPCYPSK